MNEHFEPALNRGKVISYALTFRESWRPRTRSPIAPGMEGQKGDLCRSEAEASRIVEIEVLKGIRADIILCALDRCHAVTGHEFRGNLRGKDVEKCRACFPAETAFPSYPT